MSESNYPDPVSKLLALGDVRGGKPWPDYLALGLTAEHVPDLIRMTRDEVLHWADSTSDEVWAPLHAWRALAALHAEEAVKPLTELFHRIDDYGDDWVGEDLPKALGVLGPAAISELRAYLADASHGPWADVASCASLAEIGTRHPEARDDCVAALVAQLEHAEERDPTFNAFVINALIDLKAVEAAPIIRRAFAAQRVDLSVVGDWEEVQILMGLRQARRTPSPLNRNLFDPLLEIDEKRSPEKKPGRNDPCWCGSGKKYKHCHLRSSQGR